MRTEGITARKGKEETVILGAQHLISPRIDVVENLFVPDDALLECQTNLLRINWVGTLPANEEKKMKEKVIENFSKGAPGNIILFAFSGFKTNGGCFPVSVQFTRGKNH